MRAASLVLWPAMVLLATPPIGAAQESAKTPRVAYVRSGSFAKDPYREAFLRGMRERDWIAGRNIAFEFRYYGDDAKAIPPMMQELLRLKIDVIAVGGAAATHAAQAATHSVPIVMVAGDPLGGGLITNLARPGGNTTGLSAELVFPGARRRVAAREIASCEHRRLGHHLGVCGLTPVATSRGPTVVDRIGDCVRVRKDGTRSAGRCAIEELFGRPIL